MQGAGCKVQGARCKVQGGAGCGAGWWVYEVVKKDISIESQEAPSLATCSRPPPVLNRILTMSLGRC